MTTPDHQQTMTEWDPALVAAYTTAVYTVAFPSGPAVFRVGATPEGNMAPAAGHTVTIATAYNPARLRSSPEDNERANARLRAVLTAAGHEFFPAAGASPDLTWSEPSFAVFDLEEAEARTLGRQFHQAAVLHWNGAHCALLWCGHNPE